MTALPDCYVRLPGCEGDAPETPFDVAGPASGRRFIKASHRGEWSLLLAPEARPSFELLGERFPIGRTNLWTLEKRYAAHPADAAAFTLVHPRPEGSPQVGQFVVLRDPAARAPSLVVAVPDLAQAITVADDVARREHARAVVGLLVYDETWDC